MSKVVGLLLRDFLRGLLTLLAIAAVLAPFIWLIMQPWALAVVGVFVVVLAVTALGAGVGDDLL